MSYPRCEKPGEALVEINETEITVEFMDTEALLGFIAELRKLGIEVQFDDVLYGVPWCG
jgi:EAL domain-containing protein (putative c-di-GMP-specific phosphodiesterase class I)